LLPVPLFNCQSVSGNMKKYDNTLDSSLMYDVVMKQIMAKIAWSYMEHRSWALLGLKNKRLEKFEYCKRKSAVKVFFVSSFVVQML